MNNEKFYVSETENKGKGLFAKENIKKGELVFVRKESKVYTEKEMIASKIREDHFMQIGKNKFIHILPPGCYGNHSCDPNCGIKEDKTFALKDIKKDEEIIVDYDTFEYDWRMWCKCGSPNCRKVLKGYKYLPKELKKKYKGYIQKYLLKLN